MCAAACACLQEQEPGPCRQLGTALLRAAPRQQKNPLQCWKPRTRTLHGSAPRWRRWSRHRPRSRTAWQRLYGDGTQQQRALRRRPHRGLRGRTYSRIDGWAQGWMAGQTGRLVWLRPWTWAASAPSLTRWSPGRCPHQVRHIPCVPASRRAVFRADPSSDLQHKRLHLLALHVKYRQLSVPQHSMYLVGLLGSNMSRGSQKALHNRGQLKGWHGCKRQALARWAQQ